MVKHISDGILVTFDLTLTVDLASYFIKVEFCSLVAARTPFEFHTWGRDHCQSRVCFSSGQTRLL